MRSGFDEATQRGISIRSVEGPNVTLSHPQIFRKVREIGRVTL